MFKITKDHIADVARGDKSREGMVFDQMPQYGMERVLGLDPSIPGEGPLIKFRLYDDDGELHYEGELTDDPECINQSAALRFGESDTGCTVIKVLREQSKMSGYREWTVEIG